MTKEEAREILNTWVEHKMRYTTKMNLPINDEVCQSTLINLPSDSIDNGDVKLEQWSFKGLIKIAYDLKDKD